MFTNLNYSGNHRMNRDEFEKAYAEKYTAGDVSAVFANRDFKRYTDHHIDLCWKVQKLKNIDTVELSGLIDLDNQLFNMVW